MIGEPVPDYVFIEVDGEPIVAPSQEQFETTTVLPKAKPIPRPSTTEDIPKSSTTKEITKTSTTMGVTKTSSESHSFFFGLPSPAYILPFDAIRGFNPFGWI